MFHDCRGLERDRRMVRLYEQGYSPVAIGRLFEVSPTWASQVVRRNGVQLRSAAEAAQARIRVGAEREQRMADLYQQEYTCVEIGRLFGESAGRVAHVLHRSGVELRSPSERTRLSQRSSLREQVLAEAGGCGSPTCTDPDCSVAPGHCHLPGCHEKATVPRMTNLKQRHLAGHPAMYCSRRCGGLARALPDPLPGRCGSPTCVDPRCKASPGACHRPGCDNRAKVAAKTDRSQRWVEGQPILYCSRRCTGIVESEHAIGVHARDRAALEREGLVPTDKAAEHLPRSQHRLYLVADVEVERRRFGRRIRQGVNARTVRALSKDPDAARKLQKPLAALNGTGRYGRAPALSDGEYEMASRLRAADPNAWGWRNLATEINRKRVLLNVERSARGEKPLPKVSHMAVSREFGRRAKPGVTKARTPRNQSSAA